MIAIRNLDVKVLFIKNLMGTFQLIKTAQEKPIYSSAFNVGIQKPKVNQRPGGNSPHPIIQKSKPVSVCSV
jgi:hypothetical protein